MSGVNIEERTIQFLKQHTGGVSKAVWPSSVRRYVATGKGRRRFMILKRFLLLHRLRTPDFLHTFDKVTSLSLDVCSQHVRVRSTSLLLWLLVTLSRRYACFITGQSCLF